MRKTYLYLFLLSFVMMAVSCGKRSKTVQELQQEYIAQPVDSFTGTDTAEVAAQAKEFVYKLNQKDIRSAVGMLSFLDGDTIVPLPADLMRRQANALKNIQGVRYTIDRMVFNEEKDNIVKVDVVLFDKKPGDTRPNTISLYLKPIRRNGRWYLTTPDNITDTSGKGGTQIEN